MSTTTVDANLGVGAGSASGAGPLEQKHMQNVNYRNVATSGECRIIFDMLVVTVAL